MEAKKVRDPKSSANFGKPSEKQTVKRSRHQKQKFIRRFPGYEAMVNMPPLSHRPEPSVPFCAENSEVLRFLTKMGYTFVEARRIFTNARLPTYNVVTLNPQTNLWQGTGDTSKIYEKMRVCSACKRQT
jgi:hypothetical protein